MSVTIASVEWLTRALGASFDLGPQSFTVLLGLYDLIFGCTWLAASPETATNRGPCFRSTTTRTPS